MITRQQKVDYIVEFETEWLLNVASPKECEYIIYHGWKGWANATDIEVNAKYKDLTED